MKKKRQMKKTRRSTCITNKGKTKVWQCAFYEKEYDDFGKYCWCHNSDSGVRECNCKNIFVRQKCPFFKKGDISYFLEMYEEDKQKVDSYLKEIEYRQKLQETSDRALLKYLKEKYER